MPPRRDGEANLIVYSVVEGDRFAAARRVRQRDDDWVAPPLWGSEVRNALVTQVRAGRLVPETARAAWHLARSLVSDAPVDPLGALDAAFAYGLSGYDAEFVALAEALGTVVVTDDRRVLAACPGRAVGLDAFADGPVPPDASGR